VLCECVHTTVRGDLQVGVLYECVHTTVRGDLQVGVYDPFSDDPQLGVQKIVLCCATEMLFIGGTAGQVVVLHLEPEEKEVDIKVLHYFYLCCLFYFCFIYPN